MSGTPTIERQEPGYIFNWTTQCFVRNVAYDFEKRSGVLYMNAGNCTDMSGCIAYFKSIDQDVRRIDTVAGEKWDGVYFINDLGKWEARRPR